MTIRVPHPRILLAVLLLVGLVGLVYTVTAEDPTDEPPLEAIPIGPQRELPTVTRDERASAEAALAADPVFAELTSKTSWKVTSELPGTVDGQKVHVALIIELDTPLDSEGPWKAVHCKGTVSQEFYFPYKGVTTIGAIFDSGGTRLVGFQPLPSPSLTFSEDAPTVPAPQCPEGFEDEGD